MISWTDVNSLQKQKLNLQVKLNELLKSGSATVDEINELKSEILYLDKQIEKIVGTNEIKRQQELKRKKSGIEQRNLRNFYEFKDKYKKISKMKIATTRMIASIENLQRATYERENIEEQGLVKVKV